MATGSGRSGLGQLGIVEGAFGEDRGVTAFTETRVDVELSGPRREGDEYVADLSLTAELPGTFDKTTVASIPLYEAERLRDELDRIVREAGSEQ